MTENTFCRSKLKMSPASKTKSELGKENEALKHILLQIHQLISQYMDVNANETANDGNPANIASDEGQRKRKRSTAMGNAAANKTQNMNPMVVLHKISAFAYQSHSKTDGDEASGEDDMFAYLKLHKKRPRAAETETTSTTKQSPAMQSQPTACLNTVTVLLERLTPLDIQKAREGVLPFPRNQSSIRAARRALPRKAAPKNLKELTPKEMVKILKT